MRAGPVGLVALWVSVTAVLTVTAWLAVEVVADEVGGEQARVLSASAVSSAAGTATLTPTPSSSATVGPGTSPNPTLSKSPKPTSSPSSTKHSTPNHSSTSKPTPTQSSTPKPSSSGGGGSSAVSKTFSVQGGTVAAACTGSSVSLKSAQPKDGWRVDVKNHGPEKLEIEFQSGEQENEIKIQCSGGVPVLEESDGD